MFDGSEDEDDVEGSRLPLLIVLALLVLAMFGGVVWLAYTQGVARGRGETPILAAASGPERVAPQEAGGNTVPYQGFKIYEQPAPPDDSAEAAPAAQPKPAPAALKPAVAPPPAPAKTAAATPPAAKPLPSAAKPAVAAPQIKTGTGPAPKSMAALIQQANSEPAKPMAKTPPPAAKPAAAAPVVASQATGAPRSLVTPPASAAPVAAKPAAPASAGTYLLQIGSYKSQADAEAAWKTYQAKHAALLTGYSDNVQQADLGEKGTWYRLRIGGLADKEVAVALCDRLKADGGACILGR
ncbi:MAG TPA: SPOR domain-containing protein [Rhizomicrobium sp.]|nr:SPOR domain-containing protein [Rhizomicrobium sp.]